MHGVEEAMQVAADVDYLVAGTVFPTASKPPGHAAARERPACARSSRAVRVPVLAIGGVTGDRIAEVAATGAAGIAAIGLFAGPTDRSADGRLPGRRDRVFDSAEISFLT